MQGMWSRLTVWRMLNSSVVNDSAGGGAMLTGTVLYMGVRAALQDAQGTQALFEQGLETVKMVDCLVEPGTLDIQERDEVEDTVPGSVYFRQRLRVVQVIAGITHPSHPHAHLELKLRRIVRSRTQQ
jgi:hypothetical protein